jgi:hypothetical protein
MVQTLNSAFPKSKNLFQLFSGTTSLRGPLLSPAGFLFKVLQPLLGF